MKRTLRSGYISILAVITLASIMLLMLTASFRHTIRNQEAQKKTQIRVDYTNREQAFLRAVLTEVPNSAIRNMMANSNSASNEVSSRWEWIFERDPARQTLASWQQHHLPWCEFLGGSTRCQPC